MGSKIRRTVRVKLDVEEGDEPILKETFEQFMFACQYSVDKCWNYRGKSRITYKTWGVHRLTYNELREKTDLHSALVQKANHYASISLKNELEKRKKDMSSTKPNFTSWFVAYDNRSIDYTENGCELATVDSKVEVDFVIDEDGENPQNKYLSDEWERKEATLHHEDGNYYLSINVLKEGEDEVGKTENGKVLSADIGGAGNLVVTSTGCFIGSMDFIKHKRSNYEKRTESLREVGTRSAHETIKRVGTKFARFTKDYLHKKSRKLIEEALDNDCSTIVLEDDLKNYNSDFQRWFLNKFIEMVKYKADGKGIDVEIQDTEETISTCSYCTEYNPNEISREFSCDNCDKTFNTSYNTARNIGIEFVRSRPTTQDGRATRRLALKSGVLASSEMH